MTPINIPNQWDLKATFRYKRQNMERAMRGEIERGLVELITNSDDKYRELEDLGVNTTGKIRIEVERRRKDQPTIIIVRDRAVGMSRQELFEKMGGLGGRTSGFEEGKSRRGLHGRGAKDVAAFGTVHFECIKDGEYNHLKIPPSLQCQFMNAKPIKANEQLRKKLGIRNGNGTVVTIEVNSRFNIPHHAKLLEQFSRYYSLRDIFSNQHREVMLVDISKKREDRLHYKYPEGKVVYDDDLIIPNYTEAKAHLTIRQHETPFLQERSLYREGILIKSSATIHDCTYFGLDPEPYSWRFSGELKCDFIDSLIRGYEDREEKNPDSPQHTQDNPTRLLDPLRDGLILEHPFSQNLYKKCIEVFRPLIDRLKESEDKGKNDVTDENLNKKLNNLSKEVSKLFEEKLKELEEDEFPTTLTDPEISQLSIGIHIIPPNEQNIILNQPKTFSVIVKSFEKLDASIPVEVVCDNSQYIKVKSSLIPFKWVSDDGKTGRTTFLLEGLKVNEEAYIEVLWDGLKEGLLNVHVIEPPLVPQIPIGLSFDRASYEIQVNKEKSAFLFLNTSISIGDQVTLEIISSHPDIVIRGGGKCELHRSPGTNLLKGICRLEGRQLKARGVITANLLNFPQAQARVLVGDKEPKSGIRFTFDPVEEDYLQSRYQWDQKDPFHLKIGALHPSIRRYLGELQNNDYPGKNSPLYHTVLAEVISEALTFRILEKDFTRKGQDAKFLDFAQTDFYYHRHFSDFVKVAHKCLVTDTD